MCFFSLIRLMYTNFNYRTRQWKYRGRFLPHVFQLFQIFIFLNCLFLLYLISLTLNSNESRDFVLAYWIFLVCFLFFVWVSCKKINYSVLQCIRHTFLHHYRAALKRRASYRIKELIFLLEKCLLIIVILASCVLLFCR